MTDFSPGHVWRPIADLPTDLGGIARPDLDEVLRIWQNEQASLKDTLKIDRLAERLATQWAIETGIIERLYTVERGVTETLIELGLGAIERFSTSGRVTLRVAKLIEDQRAALEFVFDFIKDGRPFSTSLVKELHQLLLRNQESTDAVDQFGRRFQARVTRGEWKKLPNNPTTVTGAIHQYCPPEFVQDEMERLISLHNCHEENEIRPEIEAAWLHHRFTQIHPFQDGNGRVARALATMVFLKARFLPLVIRDAEHRDAYLDALGKADADDLGPLVSLFANIQLQDLEDAITFIRDIRGAGIKQIAEAAAGAAKRRMLEDEANVHDATRRLIDVARRRLDEVAFELKHAFTTVGMSLDTLVEKNFELTSGWWRYQIVQAAQTYRYRANLDQAPEWVQLRLRPLGASISSWNIVVSFHRKESRAPLMAVIVFLTTPEAGQDEAHPVILGAENEFAYSGSFSDQVAGNFETWLDPAITRVLEVWQSRM